jgi:hypothetical protein
MLQEKNKPFPQRDKIVRIWKSQGWGSTAPIGEGYVFFFGMNSTYLKLLTTLLQV